MGKGAAQRPFSCEPGGAEKTVGLVRRDAGFFDGTLRGALACLKGTGLRDASTNDLEPAEFDRHGSFLGSYCRWDQAASRTRMTWHSGALQC